MNDLIGKIFGKLTVIEKTKKRTKNRNIIWKCQCDCGNICEVPTTHLNSGHTSSCGCLKQSKGEFFISTILSNNNIPFETKKSFNSCKIKKPLYFDFYVNNTHLIEYDGIQHFKYKNDGWNTKEHFENLQQHDIYKNQWCKENNIPLIRIPYTHLNKICLYDLLLEKSKFII